MTLRHRTLFLLTLAFLVIVVVIYAVMRLLLLESYLQLEADNAAETMRTVQARLRAEVTQLSVTNADYAYWDDTYAFVENLNPQYIADNISVGSAFYINRVNLIAMLDAQGTLRYAAAYDLAQDRLVEAQGVEALVTQYPVLRTPATTLEPLEGFARFGEQVLMFSAAPIRDSLRVQPARGTLIMGRVMDEPTLRAFGRQLGLTLTLVPWDETPPANFRPIADQLSSRAAIYTYATDESVLAGYARFEAIDDEPLFIVRADQPRAVYAQGVNSINSFLILLAVVGVLSALVVYALLEVLVLRSLAHLSAEVNRIRGSVDLSDRVRVRGDDELSRLGVSINELLRNLETAQQSRRLTERQMQTLIDNAPITLWLVDARGDLAFLRGKGLSDLGVQDATAADALSSGAFRVMKPMIEISRQALRGTAVAHMVTSGERMFDTRHTPLYDDQGRQTGVLGIAFEVTEQHRAQAELRESASRIERQNEQLERVNEFFRVTLDHLYNMVGRGAAHGEIINYISGVRLQLTKFRLGQRTP